MKNLVQIKAADALLGIADPEAAAAALSAQTVMAVVAVSTSDIRAVLWSNGHLDYASIVLLSEMRDFAVYPMMLVMAAITAVSLLNSDRMVGKDDTNSWIKIMAELTAFEQAGTISADSVNAVAALREVQQLVFPDRIIADDVLAARAVEL